MLLAFPTGSNTIKPDEPLGALVFHQDGSWDFRPHPDAEDKDLFVIQEFVDFLGFSMSREDYVQDFRIFQKQTENEKIADWRRENLKLVHSNTGSKIN